MNEDLIEKDQLISIDTAELAVLMDFDWFPLRPYRNTIPTLCTQSLLAKWLRKEYNIHVYPEPFLNSQFKFGGYFYNILSKIVIEGEEEFKTYEEALEKGLYEALKLIK